MDIAHARAFETREIPEAFDCLAPDGSEIRLGPVLTGGSMVHCTLPLGRASLALRHRTVEEIWCVVGGRGQVWRKQGEREEIVDVRPGVALTIPRGAHFQFRAVGAEPLRLVIVTMPPWPGDQEAVRVEGHWSV